MAFKLPSLSQKKSPGNQIQDLPAFEFKEIEGLEVIGQGSFGAVFTAKRRVNDNLENVVIKKMLCDHDPNNFVKEARMLYQIQHENIVRFKAFCEMPCAIMMEYVYFDFAPFGESKKLSNLHDFLAVLNENDNLQSFNGHGLHLKIAKDVARGLSHLHTRDIVHRDLKSANVLVSNQHYCLITNERDLGEAFQRAPIVCKLTDFGESRSRQVQTALVANSRTQRLNRGTPVFCAPEAFLHQPGAGHFSVNDLKQVDVWAYGMILFHLLNPDLRYPYQQEVSQAQDASGCLRQLLQQKIKPTFSNKYKELQATDWLPLEYLYHACTRWKPSDRPDARVFVGKLEYDPFLCENVPLLVSQATALLAFDHEVARSFAVSSDQIPQCIAPDNDGTNACSFLCIQLCHDMRVLPEVSAGSSVFERARDLIESVIMELPREINKERSMDMCYVDEAYKILRDIGVVPCDYKFEEEILHDENVFSYDSRQRLKKAVEKLATCECPSTALFCCEPYVFLVGALDEKLFLVDTHPVTQQLGGNGEGGLLKIFADMSTDACEALCAWIWKRLG